MSTKKLRLVLLVGAILAVTSWPARSAEFQSIYLPLAARKLAPTVDTLTVWVPEGTELAVQAAGDAFATDQGVEVQVVAKAYGIREEFLAAAAIGQGPDILFGAHDWLGELVAGNYLAAVTLAEEQFVPEAIDGFTYGGTLYGVPYGIECVGLFRNVDLAPTAPATWIELSQVSASLIGGAVTHGLSLPIPDPYHSYPLVTAYGGYIFGLDGSGQYNPGDVGLDNAGSIAAYTWFDDEIEAGRMAAPQPWDEAHRVFEDGEAAFLIAGPWSLGRIRASGVNYAISAFPAGSAGPGAPFLGAQGIMLNAASADLATARAFVLQYLVTATTMEQLYLASGIPPAYLPVAGGVSDPDLVALGAIAANAPPMPAIPEMALVWDYWSEAISDIGNQLQEPADALEEAADAIRAAIGP